MGRSVKHIIWQDTALMDYDNVKEWLDEIEEDYECCEQTAYEIMWDMNSEYLCDERINLNIQMPNEIIILGYLGLWDGRRKGWKVIKSGNIKDCLYSECDYNEWYVDRYNMHWFGVHHDGTNHCICRAFRKDVTEEQKERFYDALHNGKCNDRMIRRYTESLRPYVAKVYGWK